jgi:hypothetical protein
MCIIPGVWIVLSLLLPTRYLYVMLAFLVPAQLGQTSLLLAMLDPGLVAVGVGVIALRVQGH